MDTDFGMKPIAGLVTCFLLLGFILPKAIMAALDFFGFARTTIKRVFVLLRTFAHSEFFKLPAQGTGPDGIWKGSGAAAIRWFVAAFVWMCAWLALYVLQPELYFLAAVMLAAWPLFKGFTWLDRVLQDA
jgi:hypothetical protein